MEKKLINIYPLNIINSQEGNVRHIIDKNKEGFDHFSEAYISEINPSRIKGWTLHKNKISNLIVVKGHVKFVFLTSQKPNKFITFELSALENNNYLYSRICLQPNVWFAFQGLHSKVSRILNISNVLHSETISEKKDLNCFKYNWDKK